MNTKNPVVIIKTTLCGACGESKGNPHTDWCQTHTQRFLMNRLAEKHTQEDTVRCPDHRNGGATRCPRGGAALQIWQRKQWGD